MIYQIKKILSSPESEIWKAVVVMYILWFFLSDGDFDWWNNIAIAFVFLIAGWIVICIASMFSFNRNKQPTILIVNDLINTAESSISTLHLIDGKPGVFKMGDNEYELVADPEKIYFKIKGMKDMLYSVGLMKSDETCAKLDRYLNELQLMIGHDLHDYYFYKTQKDS